MNNLVAKHARKYNKSAVHKDRKKEQKKSGGETKHKNKELKEMKTVKEFLNEKEKLGV